LPLTIRFEQYIFINFCSNCIKNQNSCKNSAF
jgi:hypothetical protein